MHNHQTVELNPIFNMNCDRKKQRYHTSTNLRKRYYNIAKRMSPIMKRSLDIGIASSALLALSPLLITTIAAIKIESPGAAFFSQTRVGKNGKTFTMWKFRSMYMDAEARKAELERNNEMSGGILFKMKKDPRITRIGKFIRKFSIDELPQIWNVLCGDMSIVGPRPAIPSEVAQYSLLDRQRLRLKPGITCIWQVSGRSDIPFKQQVELDRRYISETSLLTDILLILKTIPAVITARGSY